MSNKIDVYQPIDIGLQNPPAFIRVRHSSKMESVGGTFSSATRQVEYINITLLPKELKDAVVRAIQFAISQG